MLPRIGALRVVAGRAHRRGRRGDGQGATSDHERAERTHRTTSPPSRVLGCVVLHQFSWGLQVRNRNAACNAPRVVASDDAAFEYTWARVARVVQRDPCVHLVTAVFVLVESQVADLAVELRTEDPIPDPLTLTVALERLFYGARVIPS